MNEIERRIKCKKCQSTNWRCYEEHDEWFEDKESGENYQAPVGFLVCKDCGHDWADHDESPNKWIGDDRQMFGEYR